MEKTENVGQLFMIAAVQMWLIPEHAPDQFTNVLSSGGSAVKLHRTTQQDPPAPSASALVMVISSLR